jgi:heme A synthase
MEGDVLPEAAFTLRPGWINAFENLALIQFIHRWLGPLTMLVILGWVAKLWSVTKRQDRRWILALGVNLASGGSDYAADAAAGEFAWTV